MKKWDENGSQSGLDCLVDGAAPSVLGWKHEFNKVLLSVTLQVRFNDSISKDFILFFFFNFLNFILFNFTILYWFCHISKWICHRCTCVLHSFFYEDPRWVQAIIYEYLSFIDLFKSACSSIFSGTSFAFASFFHVYMLNLLVIIGNIK